MKLSKFGEDLVNTRKEWKPIETELKNIFIKVLPEKKEKQRIIIEYNPVDDKGKPERLNGFFFRNMEEVEECIKILQDPLIRDLFSKLFK